MMSKKIIYTLVGLALVFFVGSLIIFLKSSSDSKPKKPGILSEDKSVEEVHKQEIINVKIFFLTEESRLMKPKYYEFERPAIKLDLYRKYVNLLLSKEENYITPVPDGVTLRSLYYIEKSQLLVLDFSEDLINNFPAGTSSELEFIYFIVDNICYNFKEIKMVKFMISGNEYKELTGHIDMEHPFYPDFRYIKNQPE
jgi:hypothetical protein